MARFQYRQKSHSGAKIVLALCLFIAIVALFYCGINSLSKTTDSKEKESLENALHKSITYCYATEGAYPESLAYIEENYGLTYDKDKYFVDYRVMGSNILPDVTIIEKQASGEEE